MPDAPAPSLHPVASRLLDAQVSWLLEQLSAENLAGNLAGEIPSEVDALLELGEQVTFGSLVDPAAVVEAATTLFTAVPASAGASTVVGVVADVLHAGPGEPVTPADLIDRENVERIADELHAATPLVAAALDDLTRSPLVAGLASRFVTRLVTDVLAGNQALARKVPGVGGLISGSMAVGTSAAGKVLGAGKQLDQLLGDNTAKGAAFAMRRLNKIIVDLLADPTTRDAVLEVFDLYADQPLPPLSQHASPDDVRRVADLVHDIVIAAAPTPAMHDLVSALVDGVLEQWHDTPVTQVLAELDLDRDTLAGLALAVVPPALAAAQQNGHLEDLLRSRLEPFFTSPEVASLLA
ncbi:hypothetical protein [Nocardioides acrostichi]|uniref:Uncharacterized protein n=1 Tax=Nocardioides acrostichi TaxID=2784339 RepID=A0A930Y9D7_9ACTN|nr:hypothetical protein [Nocardioides acrostichi]MBF4160253.1 hypothetical protein [Nocardioides acrostichi]